MEECTDNFSVQIMEKLDQSLEPALISLNHEAPK